MPPAPPPAPGRPERRIDSGVRVRVETTESSSASARKIPPHHQDAFRQQRRGLAAAEESIRPRTRRTHRREAAALARLQKHDNCEQERI